MSDEIDMNELIEQNYQSWREVWDLDQMTLRDVYEAGFRHGYDAAQEGKK